MDESGMVDFLLGLAGLEYDGNKLADVLTFEDAEVLADGPGVVVRMELGEEFQVFIAQTVARA